VSDHTTRRPASYRLGVDVGGTFTDLLLVDSSSGQTWRAKTASTPADQAIGVLNGISKVCAEAGITLAEVGQVLHGTTVAANAILEGKGATVGLVTTKGFRQVLQIARSFVPGGLAGWIIWPKPEPLAALEHTVEADERIGSNGRVIRPLDDDQVRAQLKRLSGLGIQALAVSLINSFAEPSHERRIAEIAAEELPGVPVSLSSDVLPELREYERALTTWSTGTYNRRSSGICGRWISDCGRAGCAVSQAVRLPCCAATAGCRPPARRSPRR